MVFTPRAATGERIYAIGDVHGCLDLFEALVAAIRRDNAGREPRQTKLVLIGDFVDRGPDSADLVALLQQITDQSPHMIVLKGNHEAMMVEALRGNLRAFKAWLDFGGEQTLTSWGLSAGDLAEPLSTLLKIARRAIGPSIMRWLEERPIVHNSGDYLFVHAGIRPDVRFDAQTPEDMLWIRDEFTSYDGPHPAMIVHGHSIVEDQPSFRVNRIALDTGAYRSGILSAVGFEDERQWTLQARSDELEAAE